MTNPYGSSMHESSKQSEIIMRKRKCFADKDLEEIKPEKHGHNLNYQHAFHGHQNFNSMMQFYSMILTQYIPNQNIPLTNQHINNIPFIINPEMTPKNYENASKKRSDFNRPNEKSLTNFSVEALLKFV